MYLTSTQGKILFEGRFTNVKHGVEMAVEKGIDLSDINLRRANLAGAQIDGAQMTGACLWGANLSGANLGDAHLQGADFRTANFLDTCLAESRCHGANFSGAYFSRTIVRFSDLSKTRFSCPSIFSLDLAEAKTLAGAVYCHLGEVDCDLSHAPLIIRGLKKPMIFMDDSVLVGADVQKISLRSVLAEGILEQISQQKILSA